MMHMVAPLKKMLTFPSDVVHYYLPMGDTLLFVNAIIHRPIRLTYRHLITCVCGKQVTKTVRQNFCFDCFQTHPAAGPAIFNPEKSRAHEGIEDRDLTFEREYQLQPHVVYLANSGGLKVGVTRKRAMLNRWMDQGAIEAVVLAETSNRYEAGLLEVFLKNHLSDKTDWRAMLKEGEPVVDLSVEVQRIAELLPEDLRPFLVEKAPVHSFTYPVSSYPGKVVSVNFQKTDSLEGTLIGIRGQYLIFDDGRVFNVRSHEGSHTEFTLL